MKRIEIGDTVTFKGEVIDIVDDLIHFEGPTVRIWRGDSRIRDVKSALPHFVIKAHFKYR
jgi:hypothetical protein